MSRDHFFFTGLPENVDDPSQSHATEVSFVSQ